jgi:hypothetical protein
MKCSWAKGKIVQRQSLGLAACCLVASACSIACSETEPAREGVDSSSSELSLPPTPPAAVTQAWLAELTAPDVARRKAAVQRAAFQGGADAAKQLEDVIANDASSDVKENAVLAYAQVTQQSGAAFLRQLALTSQDAQVLSAAHASLHDLRETAPKRGWLSADFPETFTPGKPFDVVVKLGSSSDVKVADLTLKLPSSLQVGGGHQVRWSGPLVAGVPQEIKFTVVSSSGMLQGGSMARATLQYEEALDFEVLDQRVRFGTGKVGGFFEPVKPKSQSVEVTL